MIGAGFAPGSEFLWPYHYRVYWDLTQRIYREELDPGLRRRRWRRACRSARAARPDCDADYDYAARPERRAQDACARASLTGRIGKPLITLHGTLDTLLPIGHGLRRLRRAGRATPGDGRLHRYYRIEGGTHVDGSYDLFPDRLRPLLPCCRTAFETLERWTAPGGGHQPPPSATIPRQTSGDVANTCALS